MEISGGSKTLGVIVCKYCGKLIDTIDAEKVEVHYAHCKNELCIDQGLHLE
jgi:hypothetical protein